jgi:hypothetical protein
VGNIRARARLINVCAFDGPHDVRTSVNSLIFCVVIACSNPYPDLRSLNVAVVSIAAAVLVWRLVQWTDQIITKRRGP